MEVDAFGIRYGERELRPLDAEQIALCADFLAKCERTKTGRLHSYTLKHVIERCVQEYIPNGAGIQAALDLWLTVRPDDSDFNAWIGVSKRSVRALYASYRAKAPHIGGYYF